MANKVTISNTDNKVIITPQSNKVSTNISNTPITVTQGTTKVITVNTPGPKGDQGDAGGLIGPDISIRNISASGDISASGNIIAETLFSNGVGGNLIKKQDTPTSNTFTFWTDSSTVKSYLDFQANSNNISYKPQGYGPQYSLFEANAQSQYVQLGTIDTGLTEFKVDDSNVNMTMKFTSDEITHTFDEKGIEVQGSITASGAISASRGLVIPSLDIGGLTSLGHDHKVVIANNDKGRLSISDGFTFNITDSRLVSPSASFNFLNVNDEISATSASFDTLDTEIIQPKVGNQSLNVIAGNNLKLQANVNRIEIRPGAIFNDNGHLFFPSGKIRINQNIGGIEPDSTLDIAGSVSASSTGSFEQIKLNYDTMPTSDPNIKGVVYRSSSAGIDNLLFISPGS